jgi:hypothetical protein
MQGCYQVTSGILDIGQVSSVSWPWQSCFWRLEKGQITNNAKVGVISDSHNISDSIPRICRNDASKLAPSLNARFETNGARAGSA